MARNPDALQKLIEALSRLPGIGAKTAERLAYHLLESAPSEASDLSEAVAELHASIHHCVRCHNYAQGELCEICKDPRRDASVVCVVERPQDVVSFERSGGYTGVYHVLLGAISPIDGQNPEDIQVGSLMGRVRQGDVEEVILATDPDAAGETTALYIADQLKDSGVRVTRLACGVPMGSSLEYIDEATLSRALSGRTQVG